MIAQVLAYISQADNTAVVRPATRSVMVNIIPCIFLLVGICFWGLVIFGLVKLIKYLGSAGKEQKLIRMELSKLADELERMRKKSESNEDS